MAGLALKGGDAPLIGLDAGIAAFREGLPVRNVSAERLGRSIWVDFDILERYP